MIICKRGLSENAAMKPQLLEFLLCGTIGVYCATRMYVLFPAVVRQAREVVAMAIQRGKRYEELLEPAEE